MNRLLLSLVLLPLSLGLFAQTIELPEQAASGPGGANYRHSEVEFSDFASEPEGFWLFEPASPRPDSAHVVVFVHGYGGYNPMVYGAWIRHLVLKGNIVVFPRYQRNNFFPRPNKFADNVAEAVRAAQVELDTGDHVRPIWEDLVYVGHSYGGVVVCDLVIHAENYGVPMPEAAMIVSSGTSFMSGGRLKDYSDMPEDLKLVIFVSDRDAVVGDEFSLKVFEEATATEQRILLRQYADDYGTEALQDGHNEPYAIDMEFDTGIRNYTARKVLRKGTLDPIDYNGYWKVLDALLNCVRLAGHCDTALCGCALQTDLGNWSDGTPIRPLEVVLPEEGKKAKEEK